MQACRRRRRLCWIVVRKRVGSYRRIRARARDTRLPVSSVPARRRAQTKPSWNRTLVLVLLMFVQRQAMLPQSMHFCVESGCFGVLWGVECCPTQKEGLSTRAESCPGDWKGGLQGELHSLKSLAVSVAEKKLRREHLCKATRNRSATLSLKAQSTSGLVWQIRLTLLCVVGLANCRPGNVQLTGACLNPVGCTTGALGMGCADAVNVVKLGPFILLHEVEDQGPLRVQVFTACSPEDSREPTSHPKPTLVPPTQQHWRRGHGCILKFLFGGVPCKLINCKDINGRGDTNS